MWMNNWVLYDDGRSIGRIGFEGGVIVRDEEHISGARLTLRHGDRHVSVSCNIYGCIDHTRFFNTVPDAERDFAMMKSELGQMMDSLAAGVVDASKKWEAISEFVRRFP
jgi:hypothetical protein